MKSVILFLVIASLCFSGCASQGAASAEEYFSLGMAYFELGKYAEAEKWLNRARSIDKTKTASEYNLGRIAYETGRFDDAVRHFDRVLARDKDNVLALKSAAYSRIKTGDLSGAETLYKRVLELEPDSVDQGYNYAMVLMAMDKPENAEEVLLKYKLTMADNKDTLLLLARTQKAQNKVEAVDTYSQWLAENNDTKVRYEYAQVLESGQFYARALEEYRTVVTALPQGRSFSDAALNDPTALERTAVRFIIARLLLVADSEKDDGIKELETAVTEGFTDTEKLTTLLDETGISAAHKDEIRRVIDGINKAKVEKEAADKAAAEKEAAEKAAAELEGVPNEPDASS
ncbi:tetratricopeptide repeat protein [Treponema primitia]|uniref:tetratricopeptide repeat protein n=1 Tax=Treponema primitia TaxID=88058 RepID=UPI0002555774|nr:tetratricopeptide repeat protein [Treponema primitia]